MKLDSFSDFGVKNSWSFTFLMTMDSDSVIATIMVFVKLSDFVKIGMRLKQSPEKKLRTTNLQRYLDPPSWTIVGV